VLAWYSVYLLYWYKSTWYKSSNTDAEGAARCLKRAKSSAHSGWKELPLTQEGEGMSRSGGGGQDHKLMNASMQDDAAASW
jgi:hypothetical protein